MPQSIRYLSDGIARKFTWIKSKIRLKNIIRHIMEEELSRSSGLSELERFEFDLRGLIFLRQFIDSALVEQINRIIDQAQAGMDFNKFECLTLDPVFLDLIVDKRLLKISRYFCGKNFRLDHEYCIQYNPLSSSPIATENIHGGPFEDDGTSVYSWHNAKPHCTQIVIGFILSDSDQGDGGLVFIPGSHKSNTATNGARLTKLLNNKLESNPLLENPELRRGDVVIFSEALIHGTVRWKPKERMRRILYYRINNGSSGWRDYSKQEPLKKLARNETERRLLSGPYVGDYTVLPNQSLKLSWRKPTLED